MTEGVDDRVQSAVRAHERYADTVALTGVEWIRLAVRAAARAGAVLLIARTVSDMNFHGYAPASASSAYFPEPLSAA